jgi:hypothetical protein
MTPAARRIFTHHRRGTAFMAAVLLMIVVASIVTLLAIVFAAQARRTRSAVAGAQLRQLLLAADPIARADLAANGTAARTLTPPIPVEGATLTIVIQPPADGASTTVDVTATLRQMTGRQILHYAPGKDKDAWITQDTQLIQSP